VRAQSGAQATIGATRGEAFGSPEPARSGDAAGLEQLASIVREIAFGLAVDDGFSPPPESPDSRKTRPADHGGAFLSAPRHRRRLTHINAASDHRALPVSENSRRPFMSAEPLALFALAGSVDYAKRLAAQLEVPLAPLEERSFEDGEHKSRPLIPVEGADAYVVHTLYGDATHTVNDKLCRLLFLLGTLKDHGATRVTAVVPYLCYARKDRRTQPYDPVTQRYVAALFEAVGTDRMIVLEVHNTAALENAFRCPTHHINTAELFAEHFSALARNEKIVAVSPDAGGVKRVELFRRALERRSGQPVDNAFVEKYRSGGVVTGGALVGGVEGRTAIILDDLIATGNTLLRAAKACRAAGARRVFAAAAHGLFTGGASDLFTSSELNGLVIADSIAVPTTIPPAARDQLTILDTTALVAAAIGAAHGDG